MTFLSPIYGDLHSECFKLPGSETYKAGMCQERKGEFYRRDGGLEASTLREAD